MERVRRPFPIGPRTLIALSTLLAAVGCGNDGPKPIERVPLSGAVTYNGAAIEKGTVALMPTGAGQPVSTAISKGKYSFTKEDGPSRGGYHVTITRAGAEEVEILPNRGFGAGGRNFPPPKKPVSRPNEKNSFELDFEVPASGSFDFTLKD